MLKTTTSATGRTDAHEYSKALAVVALPVLGLGWQLGIGHASRDARTAHACIHIVHNFIVIIHKITLGSEKY